MQRKLIGVLALSFALAITGCSKKGSSPSNENQNQTPPVEVPQAPATENRAETPATPVEVPQVKAPEFKYTRTCEQSVTDENCTGRYGFAVYGDGSFQVGPGPQGQLRKGKLTTEQFAEVNSKFSTAEIFSLASFSAPTCTADAWNWNYGANITMERDGNAAQSLVEVKLEGTEACFQSAHFASLEQALALEDSLDKLVKEYAANFPSAADSAAVSALTAAYPEVQACEVDADCAYINDTFAVAAEGEWVFNSCSDLTPIRVGNAKAVAASKDKLAGLWQAAVAAGAKAECTGDGFLVMADKPAKCSAAKMCTINPEL